MGVGKGQERVQGNCFRKILRALGHNFVLKSVGNVELIGGLVPKHLI